MTTQPILVVDSHVVSYLAGAIFHGQRPAAPPAVWDQQVAVLRLFLWGVKLTVTPRVLAEVTDARRRDAAALVEDRRVAQIQLHEITTDRWDRPSIDRRLAELLRLPSAENHRADCEILAEAEFGSAQALLTYDRWMRRNLPQATAVAIRTPLEEWESRQIPRGTPPVWEPSPPNPLASETFWRWD